MLLRLTGDEVTATGEVRDVCHWMLADSGCTAAQPSAAWLFRVHALVPARTTGLTRLDIDATYADDNGGSNHYHLLRYRSDSVGDSSKPLAFRVAAQTLRGLSLSASYAGEGECRSVSESCALGLSDVGDLLPGTYAWLLSASALDPSDFIHSGDRTQPLARRDGAAVKHDYLAFSITESA